MNPFLSFSVVLLLAASSTFAQVDVDYRLPAHTVPSSQHVELRLDPTRPDYSGSTRIALTVKERTERIGVYQIGLALQDIRLVSASGSRTLSTTPGEWDISWLSDGDPIEPGEYELSIEFAGEYSTDSLGMHRVTFEDHDYVFTQMEAMYARRAFPLFDEPAFKIPYQLTISAPAGQTIVSNTPEESRDEQDGWERVTFAQTKPLPSYLLAYAVGPLDRVPIEGLSVPGFIYTPKGRTGELGFVLRETPKIVGALETYFGSSYPYRKLDFVAVPEFAFGAMENPGLITYRTDLLLVGDNASGTTAEGVLNVIAHEVAHIWYGDLVTMRWWDDLWLNEAFATWMAKSTLERLYPEYDTSLKLAQADAFGADQRTTSKAIRRTVRNNDEIFDGIGLNYSKGHALLRMLENYVGADIWRDAIREYLDRFAWSNATEQDLWAVVSEVSGLDIAKIAGDFLNQPGFPTLTVAKNGEIAQERYLALGREAPDLSWRIPLNIKYKQGGEIRQTFHLLEPGKTSADLPEDADWVFPDAGGNGYYRWQTDLERFYNLIEDVDALTNREKIALLHNTEALLDSGDISLADYLFVLNRFLRDPYPLVFLPTLEKVKEIGDEFVGDDNRAAFARFIDQALGQRFEEVGTETRSTDSEALIQMRPRLVRVLGQYGTDTSVRKAAADIATTYLETPDRIASDLGREALRITAMNDGGGLYSTYRQAYLDSSSADQRTNILASIYFANPEVVAEHLDFSISEDVAAGDSILGLNFYSTLLGDHAPLYAWLEDNLDDFLAKIPSYYHPLVPQIVGQGVCNQQNLEQLSAFFNSRDESYAGSLAKALETAENCIARRTRHADALSEFLARY